LIYISGEVSKQQKLRPFDILIVMSSGSKEHIGKNGVYYFEQDNAFGAFCSKITPQKVFFEFISIFLQSNNFRNYVKNQCLGTNINNLNNSHILHCPIVRPNDEYIEAFHKQIKLIYEKISCNVKQNHQLTQLRDFLLPMLMNGQVSVAE
jgi:type-1 restriction enzyme ecoKI specificity protein